MVDSVRERILKVIAAKLATVTNVGAVIESAALADEKVASIVSGGQNAIEWAAGDDSSTDDTGQGPSGTTDAETLSFSVDVLVHLADGPLTGGRTWQGVAAGVASDIYQLYSGNEDKGRWLEADTTPLAINTDVIGGGGVSMTPLGTRAVAHSFRVTYRHAWGSPDVLR